MFCLLIGCSLVYIFTKDGNFITNITTKENVPIPQITNFNETYMYKRGHTFSTNIGSFVIGNDIHIISNRVVENKNAIIVDRYSIKNSNYNYAAPKK